MTTNPTPEETRRPAICPDPLPRELRAYAEALALAWLDSPARPAAAPEITDRWDQLLGAWADSDDLPLYVRRFHNDRGTEYVHPSGRKLVPVDNSLAHWTLSQALRGECPSFDDVLRCVLEDRIPVAMAMRQEERRAAVYKCSRSSVSLNDLGWKVCHLDGVALGGRGALVDYPLAVLREHFLRYASPSNMVLVPLAWAGLGEMPEFIKAASQRRAQPHNP